MLRVAGCQVMARCPVVVILGATGAGKSQLALELAAKFGGEIISADAMQMYKGLDIVTNKVTEEEQKLVKHHMINILDPLCHNNVVDFRNKALPIVENLLTQGKIPVICGGTNYYIESLLWKILIDEDLPYILAGKRLIDENNENIKMTKLDEETEEGVLKENDDISIDSVDWSNDDGHHSTAGLYSLLKSVDPDRATVLHPRERRKIWRSLQVFSRTGQKHSELLGQQGGAPGSGLGGGLRFDRTNICIIEVWSEQSVLEERCDKRVEKMMKRGLLQELQDFHDSVNKLRVTGHNLEALNYDKGIWQSIGFKEFHSYLCLPPELRDTEEGRTLFNEGVVRMKISTRQYSRRQAKWIRRRFLTDIRDSPPVYRVDSSDPSTWLENVFNPAEKILQSFLCEGTDPEIEPLPRISERTEREEEYRKTLHCDVCNRDLKGDTQFRNHLKSKSHRKALQALTDKFAFEMKIISYETGKKTEVAKVIKNTFAIGLADVLAKLENMPSVLSTENSLKKCKKISKELEKLGIVTDIQKVSKPVEGDDSVSV